LGLIAVIGYMIYRVTQLRKEKAEEDYHELPDGTELTHSRF
jgi:hypothetical protein